MYANISRLIHSNIHVDPHFFKIIFWFRVGRLRFWPTFAKSPSIIRRKYPVFPRVCCYSSNEYAFLRLDLPTLLSQTTVEVFMWHFSASFCIVILGNRHTTKLYCTTVSIVSYYPVGRLWVKNSAYLLITDGFHSSLVYESEYATAFKAPCSEKQGAFPFLIPMAIICVSTYS